MKKLTFQIAGVQKCGTTALHRYLAQHPGLSMSRNKETHFFDDESIDWSQPDYTRLHRRFPEEDGNRLRGESTPITLYWKPAHERMYRYNRDLKLILLFRDPALRAHSHWRMESARGWEKLDFATAIREGRDRIRPGALPPVVPEMSPRQKIRGEVAGLSRVHSYVERGLYAAQLKCLLRYFPRSNMLFLRSEDLLQRPGATIGRICDFLEIPGHAGIRYERHNIGRHPQTGQPIAAEDMALMRSVFRPDLAEFARLTGLDITDWPSWRQ